MEENLRQMMKMVSWVVMVRVWYIPSGSRCLSFLVELIPFYHSSYSHDVQMIDSHKSTTFQPKLPFTNVAHEVPADYLSSLVFGLYQLHVTQPIDMCSQCRRALTNMKEQAGSPV